MVFSPPISQTVHDLGFGPPPMEIGEGGEGKPPPEGLKKPASTPEGGEVKPSKRQMKSPYQLELLEKTYAGLLIDPFWILSWSIFLGSLASMIGLGFGSFFISRFDLVLLWQWRRIRRRR